MSKTPLETQADRIRALAEREGLMITVKARPETGTLLLHREWVLADQPIAVERGYVLETLTSQNDRAVAEMLVREVGRIDRILIRKAAPLLIGAARRQRMSWGDTFEDVSL